MYKDLLAACIEWGLGFREDKLSLWSNIPGGSVRLGATTLEPVASMEFLGAVLCGEPSVQPGHRVDRAWKKFWALKSQMCNRTLSARVRLQKLRAEIVPVLMWGSAA